MTEPRKNRLILLALWLVFYASFTLFSPPLLDDADSVHAEVAREMLLRHDFVTLYANGIRYLEKAPLFYWSEAASMAIFGPTTAASRLPLAFSVLALALLLETFARRAFLQPRAGLYAGLITLSSFGIFIFSRINIPDVLVCVLLCISLHAYWQTEQQELPSRHLCWLFDAAIALNLLTKGLIGIVFPLGIVLLHLLLTRGLRATLRRLRQFHPLSSTAILLAIAVPWHILIALANPGHGHPGPLTQVNGHWQVPYPTDGNVHGWAWFYFINEQLFRYLNLRIPHDYDTAPLYLFLGLIFIWLMPWSTFLPSALARALKSLRSRVPHPLQPHRKGWGALSAAATNLRTLTPQASTNLLLLLWIVLPLAFFTFSTRQEYYVLPALPPMILLIAALLAHRAEDKVAAETHRNAVGRPAFWLSVAGIAVGIFCVYLIRHTSVPDPSTDLASLLQQNPADYALSFGHFLDLNQRAMGMFRLPLILTAIAFGLGFPISYILRRPHNFAFFTLLAVLIWFPRETRKRVSRNFRHGSYVHFSNLALAASAFLFLFAAHRGLVIFSPTLTSAQLADTIRPQLHPQDLLAIHGEYEAGSTLGFYLQRNDLHLIEGRSSNLWYGSFFPDAPRIFETPATIARKWSSPQRIFLWQDPHDPDRPPLQLPAPIYVLATSGGKQILSNQPNR